MFKFHPNLKFKKNLLKQFPAFYHNTFNDWNTFFSTLLKFLLASSLNIFQSMVLTVFISYFIKMVSQKKKRKILQTEYKLDNSFNFQWYQLVYALPESSKKSISPSDNSNNILLCTDYYITRKSRMITAGKLTAKEIYINLISMTNCKPSSQICFDNLFQNKLSCCWDQIYILPCKLTVYSYMRCFLYISFLNKKLYIFRISETPLCSFSHTKEETAFHIFFECCNTQSLWEDLRKYFHDHFSLPILSPQTVLFGFLDFSEHEDLFLFNRILLVFKFYLYFSNYRRKNSAS